MNRLLLLVPAFLVLGASGARASDELGPIDPAIRGLVHGVLKHRLASAHGPAAGQGLSWRHRLRELAGRDLYFGEYFAHRNLRYSGDVAIDTSAGEVAETLKVDVVIVGKDRAKLYFTRFLPVTAVEDAGGAPLVIAETSLYGYPLVEVTLPAVAQDGDLLSLTFHLAGKPDCEAGAGVFGVLLCSWGPVSFVAGDLLVPGSLSGDFYTMDLRFTLASDRVLAATGIVKEVLPGADDGHKVHHVVQDFRTDSTSFGIAPYEKATVPYKDKWVGVFATPNPTLQPSIWKAVADIVAVLDHYSARYGDFLFPKMEVCQVTDNAGAAFGWPALIWFPDGMFYMGTDGDPGGMEQRTALLSHELAHQWFPDMIRMNDGYGAWLSEGWSEFSSIDFLSTLHDPGWANGMFSYYGLLYQYAIEPWDDYGLTSKESIQVSNPWAYQIITYYKGATVTATLRSVLGEEVFYKAVRQLYSDLAGKDETYETKDLQKYFEDASGQDLQWLFDEWVYRTGFPIYTVGVSRGTTAEGRPKATVTIGRGTSVTGHDFRMPVKLRLVTDAGDLDHVEILDQAQSTFTWEHDGRLVRVQVDPDQTFIRRLRPALPGDLDLSGEVDGIDLIYVSWAQDSSFFHGWNFLPYADMDGSGTVGSEDLQAVTNAFAANSDEVQP